MEDYIIINPTLSPSLPKTPSPTPEPKAPSPLVFSEYTTISPSPTPELILLPPVKKQTNYYKISTAILGTACILSLFLMQKKK